MALVWTFQLLFLLLISCHHATANCGDPTVPTNGSIGTYQNTSAGTKIVFGCNPGFVPAGNMTAVCASDGSWTPDPATLVCTLVSRVSLLPWHIALSILGVLALLVALLLSLTGMVVVCGFRYCCWILVIALLMGSTVGVPLGIVLILHRSMKEAKNEQCRNGASLGNKITWNGRAGCYYGLYFGLTIFATVCIVNGLGWWIVLAGVTSRPANDNLRSFITLYVLMAFCFSVAGLISAIVAVIFIIPYHKYKGESKVDYDQPVEMSHQVADGGNPEDEN